MAHQLLTLLKTQLANGLKRKAIMKCSVCAETYRMMCKSFPGKWTFIHHPWTREIHDCQHELIVGQKAAQMGFTEVALNRTFFAIDILGDSVLYVLPASHPDATDFSTSRFDPALELSPHLSQLFSDVKNIGHKRAGSANLFIRGSRSRSQMKSLPVAKIIFDELDEMNLDNVVLAKERVSGQVEKDIFEISTPTIEGRGINAEYLKSDQRHFMFRCPHCGRWTELTFPDCLKITADDPDDIKIKESYLVCKECGKRLSHESKIEWLSKGKWVPSYSNRVAAGYHINQLYSMTVQPWELAAQYLRAGRNPADEQEFYNSKLGLPHVVEGAQVSDKDIKECIGGYKMFESIDISKTVTMGVDVGKWLHYEIDEWIFDERSPDINSAVFCRVLRVGKVLNFEELDALMFNFGINFVILDANPERRKALEFCNRFYGHAKICYYTAGVAGRNYRPGPEEEMSVAVDRTSWLDLSLGRFKNRRIKLPLDISTEYKNHIKALVRIYREDSMGNPVGRYEKADNAADHYAHARNYAEIAVKVGLTLGDSANITGIY